MRLIAQYPNVGNSGHIFLVPPGQMEGALAIGEKINTQMLSLEKDALSDSELDKAISLKSIKGHDFISVIYPVKQILSEKGTERVGYVWIASEGFDVTVYEDQIPKLLKSLSNMIPKLDSVVARLGYLDSNVARCIELPEMAEWKQSLGFLDRNVVADNGFSSRIPLKKSDKITLNFILGILLLVGAIAMTASICVVMAMQFLSPLGVGKTNDILKEDLKAINKKLKSDNNNKYSENDLAEAKKFYGIDRGKKLSDEFNTDKYKRNNDLISIIDEFVRHIKKEYKEIDNPNLSSNAKEDAREFANAVSKIKMAINEKKFKERNELIQYLEEKEGWLKVKSDEYQALVEELLALINDQFTKTPPFCQNNGPYAVKELEELKKFKNVNPEFLKRYGNYRNLYPNTETQPPSEEGLKAYIDKLVEFAKKPM